MSHFTVLVIGDDVDAQLAPFHEFECTGVNDKYVVNVDRTAEVQKHIDDGEALEDALGYFGIGEGIIESEDQAQTEGEDPVHKYGYAVVKDGKLVKAVDRTNPNKKWDWYQVGGRWVGFFYLKPGATGTLGEPSWASRNEGRDGKADSALKGAIDFEKKRNERGLAAGAEWDAARAITGGETWKPWELFTTVESGTRVDYNAAREAYWAQPAVAALKNAEQFRWDFSDTLAGSREDYVQAARNGANIPYAIVYKGEWSARGDMGWFGMAANEIPKGDWAKLANDLIDGLPDDTRLTIVDCHI